MNEAGILHIPDSRYCFAINENELVIRFRLAKEDRDVKVFLLYGMKYDYQTKRKEKEIFICYEDKLFVYFEVKLHLDDTRFAYIFRLEKENELYYFSEDGVTQDYDFSNAFYNFFQMPYINQADLFPCVPWMKEAVFYQIFVDRFCKGNEKKNQSYITMNWGEKPTPTNFAGGDLQGILAKLDYLSDLGINAIYLSPIFTSPSNHKYDRKITLPYILTATTPVLIGQFVGNFNNFGIFYFLRGSLYLKNYFLASDTDLLINWLYNLSIDNNYYSIGASISLIIFLITSAISLTVYVRTSSYKEGGRFS